MYTEKILDQILSKENLIQAYKKVKSNKGVAGVDGHLRFRLRMCIWKQWKKTRTKFANLMKLGIDKQKAWEWANTRKGYARVAMSYILCRAITNKRLEKFGLLSLTKQYQLTHS